MYRCWRVNEVYFGFSFDGRSGSMALSLEYFRGRGFFPLVWFFVSSQGVSLLFMDGMIRISGEGSERHFKTKLVSKLVSLWIGRLCGFSMEDWLESRWLGVYLTVY